MTELGPNAKSLVDRYPLGELSLRQLIDAEGLVYGFAVTTSGEPQFFKSPFTLSTGTAAEMVEAVQLINQGADLSEARQF